MNRTPAEWNDVYRKTPVEKLPWFFADLDPDFDQALQAIAGDTKRVLDICTGPGTQAIALAERGFSVVGIDVSPAAIEQARVRARERGTEVHFRVDNILHSDMTGPFDYVLDRGVFHTFVPSDRSAYIRTVYQLLRPEGYMLLKCFSHLQPGSDGPHRFAPADIRAYYQQLFSFVSLEESVFFGSYPPVRALFCVLQRKP